MTIKEFFESSEEITIHCDTEEKATILLKAFDKSGYKWANGTKYTVEDNWEDYKEETCYSNRGLYAFKGFYQSNGYKILEFDEIEF